MADRKAAGNTRRDFLKLGATSVPAAVAVVAASATGAAAEPVEAPRSAGLRKTEHVETYLRTARF